MVGKNMKRIGSILRQIVASERILFIISLSFVCVVLVLFAVFGSDLAVITSPTLASEEITTDGGTIDITEGSLEGLSLEIMPDSYDDNIEVVISTADSSDIPFVEDFNPITPLILIDNLHEYSNEPMELTIPIDIDTTEDFAMAFFYDEETGELEAIPTVSLDNDNITIATSHFSVVVVSTITIEKLMLLGLDVENADSGFRPGVDDWSFTNRGSFAAPNGHCAGQSITSIYYYVTRKKARGDDNLWDRFDNNGGDKTPDLWVDDSLGYQYASLIQYKSNWRAKALDTFLDFGNESDYNVYYSFLYAIHITKNPQLIYIYEKDMDDNYLGGHAMIVYKVQDSKLYVADPNYPGQANRFIEFNAFDVLGDYSSGANATDIATNGATLYSDFAYIGLSANINFTTLEDEYIKMLELTMDPLFDLLTSIKYGTHYDDTLGHMITPDIEGAITLPEDYNDGVPERYKNKVVVIPSTIYRNIAYTIYRGTDVVINRTQTSQTNDFTVFIVPLVEGENDLGILIEVWDGKQYNYLNFERIDLTYLGTLPTPEEEAIGKWIFDFPDTAHPNDINEIDIYANGTFKRTLYWEEGLFSGTVFTETGTYVVRDHGDGSYDVVLYYDGSDVNSTYIFSADYTSMTFTGPSADTYIKETD